jgi:hypothetical protein
MILYVVVPTAVCGDVKVVEMLNVHMQFGEVWYSTCFYAAPAIIGCVNIIVLSKS